MNVLLAVAATWLVVSIAVGTIAGRLIRGPR